MNLKVSYNWLKEYVKTNLTANEFAQKLSLGGPSVEKITAFDKSLAGVVVGKIIAKEKHPGADRLFIGKIDIGKKNIQIVFGDKAVVEVGQELPVAVAPTTLPTGQEIKKGKFRGTDSEGMLCLDSELGISGEDKITFFDAKIKPGTPLTQALKILDDQILEIEITSNRPDAMSVIGLAREVSAVLDEKLLYQEPKPNLKISQDIKLGVTVKENKLCSRYQALVMTGVKVESSPLWLQWRLLASGLRPINNLVDITNYILLEFGQPMHVFDYQKLKGGKIIVRNAQKGETILALDGKNYQLTENNLIIADSQSPVAIAGVMGGELSAASPSTKTIVLESANFDPVSIRKTARSLNLMSDSSSLFEKGLPPENTTPAILRAVELVRELAGGEIASKIFDEANYKTKVKEISLSAEEVKKVLAVEIKPAEIKSILSRLGFGVAGNGTLKMEVPFWRTNDVKEAHDLIEEVARIYGYHKLPAKIMTGAIPVSLDFQNEFIIEDKVKDILVGLGYSENINYSFISEKLITNCSLKVADHLKIANPLSGDFEFMRTTLVPGLLQSIQENERLVKDLKIFELSRSYLNREKDLPLEKTDLAVAVAQNSPEQAFFDLKGALTIILQKLNIADFGIQPVKAGEKYWSNNTAEILIENKPIGYLGLIDSDTLTLLGLKKSVAILEIDFKGLREFVKASPVYQPLAKFPAIELDISMEINQITPYQKVVDSIKNINPLIKQVLFLSVYQDENIPDGKKALAIRLVYRDDNKTLELKEAQTVHTQVVEKLKKEYNINVR